MVKVSSNGRTERSIKESSSRIRERVAAPLLGKTVEFMKEIGMTGSNTDMACSSSPEALDAQESGRAEETYSG